MPKRDYSIAVLKWMYRKAMVKPRCFYFNWMLCTGALFIDELLHFVCGYLWRTIKVN